MESSSATGAQSTAMAVGISRDISHEHSVCSSNGQVMADLHSSGTVVNPDAGLQVTEHCGVADACVQSDTAIDVVSKVSIGDDVNDDVQDQSSFETTLDYSVCSEILDSKIAEKCETQTTVEYFAEPPAEPIIDAEKTPVADIRKETSLTNDIQKPVDLLSVTNGVNVDLRNKPTVCSPPTLMVV